MAKDTYYFKHDCNARNDIKILKLRRDLGMEGYGIYFALIEVLRDQDNYKLSVENIDDIAFEFRVDSEKLNKIIRNYGLFTVDTDVFYSPSLLVRMEEYNILKAKRIKAGQAGRQAQLNGQTPSNSPANASDSDGQTPAIPQALEYTKEENTTLNKSKPKQTKEQLFDIFWDAYGKKTDTARCKAKFVKLSNKDIASILETVQNYVRAHPDSQFRKNPLTYLNGQCWKDEIQPPKPTPITPTAPLPYNHPDNKDFFRGFQTNH